MEKEIINYSEIHGVALASKDLPTAYPTHWHNSAEFMQILKKGCEFTIGDEVFNPEPGDILLVWPNELHTIENAPKDGYTLLQFSSTLIDNNTDISTGIRFLSKFHLISKKNEPELAKKVTDLISDISDLYTNKQYFVETKIKISVYNILLLIGEHVMMEHREFVGERRFSDATWDYIRSACHFIREHSTENITESEVASAIGLSPFYFSKIFKEYTDNSFPAYLTGIRIQNVISLLVDETLTITDCAFSAGFQSTTTFNKAFREYTGCSPRDYRKLHSSTKYGQN